MPLIEIWFFVNFLTRYLIPLFFRVCWSLLTKGIVCCAYARRKIGCHSTITWRCLTGPTGRSAYSSKQCTLLEGFKQVLILFAIQNRGSARNCAQNLKFSNREKHLPLLTAGIGGLVKLSLKL